MPSVISHAAAGAAISLAFAPDHTPARFWPLAVAVAALPDADSGFFYFRIPYSHILGHRGFFHSPFLGLIVSLVIVAIFFRGQELFSTRWLLYLFVFFLSWTSHGLLDALTNGGRGVAFLAPFSSRRFFFPWTPIQVAPISVRQFIGSWGASVLKSEFLWIWLPGGLMVLFARIIRLIANR